MSKNIKLALLLTAVDNMSRVVGQATNKAQRSLEQFQNSRTFRSMQQLGDASLVAGAGIATGFGFAIKAAADLEQKQVALRTAFQGNQKAASDALRTIEEFASKTPYDMDQALGGFLKLKNMGLDPSMEALTSYGNTASAMGKSLNDMVEAVADAATGEFERLKEFGIKASSQGDKVTFTFRGVKTTVAKESGEIEKYLQKIGNTYFAGGMDEQSKTLNGQMSTLKDNMTKAAAAIGNVLLPSVVSLVEKVAPLVENVTAWAKENPNLVKGIAAVGVGLLAFGVTVKTITGAMAMMNAVMAINPIVLIVGAVVGAIALIAFAVYKYWTPISTFFKNMWEGIKNLFSKALQGIKFMFLNFTPLGLLIQYHKQIIGFGIKFFEAGKNIVTNIWNGIKAMASKPVEAIKDIVTKVREFLPFSPAKVGPLKDIHRIKLVETIAASIKPFPVVQAMQTVAQSVATMGAPGRNTMAPAMATGGGGSIVLNYSPNISFSGANGGEAPAGFMEMLRKHQGEIARMLEDLNDRRNRTKF